MVNVDSWDRAADAKEADVYPPDGRPDRELFTADSISRWAMLCHLSALAAFAIPFGHIVGPLVVWLINRDIHPFVDEQGKESINFQLSMTLYAILATISILLLVGIILLPAVLIMDVVCVIRASLATSRGERYQYPLTIRFVA